MPTRKMDAIEPGKHYGFQDSPAQAGQPYLQTPLSQRASGLGWFFRRTLELAASVP